MLPLDQVLIYLLKDVKTNRQKKYIDQTSKHIFKQKNILCDL